MTVIAHSMRTWLPQTQAWLHMQLSNTPGVRHAVVAETVEHLDQFPMDVAARTRMSAAEADAAARRHPRWTRWQRERFLVTRARRAGAQAIHSHFGNQAWRNLGAVRRLGVPHVASFYGYDAGLLPQRNPAWRQRYADLFANTALALAEGPHMAATLRGLGSSTAATRVHALGVDLTRLAFQPPTWRPGEPLRVLMAGRYIEKKGFPDGVEALGRLAQEMPVEATLIGAPNEEARSQEEASRIRAAQQRTGLRLREPGLVPYAQLLQEARRHHVFLAPSVTASDGDVEGGAPFVILEMAALGLPVVASTHCDIPFVLPPESRPYLAAERDVPGLVTALRRLADRPDAWGELAAAQRRHLEQGFDARRQGTRLAALYEEVVRGA